MSKPQQLQFQLGWEIKDKNTCPGCGNHIFSSGHEKMNDSFTLIEDIKIDGEMCSRSYCSSFNLIRKHGGKWGIN